LPDLGNKYYIASATCSQNPEKIPEISKLRQLVFKRIETAVNGPGFQLYKIKGFSCNRMLIIKVLVIDGN